ncbi:MAG TPA: RRXRR domain-containing protein, partial [Puia sp.]|nr:RRXRR domain-containing protein [Puia sp.]
MFKVPVINIDNQPLMPTTLLRAKRWILSKRATPFWKKGIFCIRLNEKVNEIKQDIAVGIDPGSKKEGFTIKSKAHTYLNIQADAVTWVKDAVEVRKFARRGRRYRKTPCRSQRLNRARGGLSPSTRARWQWKLRILNWLKKMFPITDIVVEDIKARSMGQRKWDKTFSPLEIGKKWFYSQINPI